MQRKDKSGGFYEKLSSQQHAVFWHDHVPGDGLVTSLSQGGDILRQHAQSGRHRGAQLAGFPGRRRALGCVLCKARPAPGERNIGSILLRVLVGTVSGAICGATFYVPLLGNLAVLFLDYHLTNAIVLIPTAVSIDNKCILLYNHTSFAILRPEFRFLLFGFLLVFKKVPFHAATD